MRLARLPSVLCAGLLEADNQTISRYVGQISNLIVGTVKRSAFSWQRPRDKQVCHASLGANTFTCAETCAAKRSGLRFVS